VTEDTGYVLRIERTFDAPADEVFDAWTSPEVMRRWFHCFEDWETPVAEVDLREGGQVRVAMRKPDGSESRMGGEYRVIERPRRLVMTWTFYDDEPGNEQLIELTFSESEGSTTVVMVNSRISSDRRVDSQDMGWNGCFTELQRALAG
jgi:uncharacterized protein YndB with AHSA1/START domain